MVLGLLASAGPRHGHQIRRDAELTNVSNWGGVSVGAIYRELRTMEEEQLVKAVRTEKVGNRPARTVYEITGDGTQQLERLRAQAICDIRFGTDAFGVALLFGRTSGPGQLVPLLTERRRALTETRDAIASESRTLFDGGIISELDVVLFRRRQGQLSQELQWLDELEEYIARLLPDIGDDGKELPAAPTNTTEEDPS
ncbi:PadR family transcriptional regulator [Micromonospora sp. PTRAS2]